MTNIRVGMGYDVHKMESDLPLIIGGVKIPSPKGCVAHSDGDTLIHAICDALLGATGLRDIGYHFPDTDNSYKGIDSGLLLEKVCDLLQSKNWQIINIDSTICLQKPKLKDYIPLMVEKLSGIMNIGEERISIKATTTEKLGFVGNESGMSAYAVSLVEKVS